MGLHQRGDVAHRLDDARLVVGGMDRHEGKPVRAIVTCQFALQRGHVDDAVGIHADARDRLRRETATIENAGMVGCRNYEARHAHRRLAHTPVRRQEHRSRLGRTRREDHMLRLAAGQRRHVAARLVYHAPCSAPVGMDG